MISEYIVFFPIKQIKKKFASDLLKVGYSAVMINLVLNCHGLKIVIFLGSML